MLHITGSTKTLKEELRVANGLINDIMGTLSKIKPSDNLALKIGEPYIQKMPKFKVLEKDAEGAKHLLRKVCSGEITPMDAYWRFYEAQEELNELRNALDSVNL